MQTLSISLYQAYFAKDSVWLSAVVSVAAWGKNNLGSIPLSWVLARNSILIWSRKIPSRMGWFSLLLINEDVLVIIPKSTRKHCLISSLHFSFLFHSFVRKFPVYFLEIWSLMRLLSTSNLCWSLLCAVNSWCLLTNHKKSISCGIRQPLML